MNKTTLRNRLLIALTIFLGLCGIFLPEIILTIKNNANINTAATLSTAYYSGITSTISRNASSQLSNYQKMMLISGAWESETSIVPISESTITEYEAATLAQEALDELYAKKNYPCSLSQNPKVWYTWSSTLYKATDANFHAYSAYYWKLVFERYDGEERHTVLITEDGTLLCAYTNVYYLIVNSITDYMQTRMYNSVCSYVAFDGTVEELPVYPNAEISTEGLRIKDASIMVVGNQDFKDMNAVREAYSDPASTNEYYYIYQTISGNAYAYTVIPYQP